MEAAEEGVPPVPRRSFEPDFGGAGYAPPSTADFLAALSLPARPAHSDSAAELLRRPQIWGAPTEAASFSSTLWRARAALAPAAAVASLTVNARPPSLTPPPRQMPTPTAATPARASLELLHPAPSPRIAAGIQIPVGMSGAVHNLVGESGGQSVAAQLDARLGRAAPAELLSEESRKTWREPTKEDSRLVGSAPLQRAASPRSAPLPAAVRTPLPTAGLRTIPGDQAAVATSPRSAALSAASSVALSPPSPYVHK